MKRFFYILLAALLLLTLAACQKAPEAAEPADEAPGWQAKYDLGVRYLSEGKYEEAILAFEAAIEIDPKNADAYRKLAEAYEQTGDENAALRALRDGAEATGDQTLAGQAREKQQELLESSFPAALSPDCTEYVSYEPGSGARQQEQPDDLLLYRIVNVDGVNGPEWYGLYGSAESSGWCGLLYYARLASDGEMQRGVLTLPAMDAYDAQVDVVLYPGTDGIWSLAVYSTRRNHADNLYRYAEPCTITWEVTAYTLGDSPTRSGSWRRRETEPSDSDDWENQSASYAANEAARDELCAQLQAAGLPFFPDGTDNMNEVLLSTAAARQTVWLHHCDHFVLGTVGSDTTHLRRDWSKEELAAHETWFQQEAEEASEGEAMRTRYKLELRPGMARTGTRVGGSDDGWHYGQFAVVDTQTGQDAALFYVNYMEEENELQRAYPDNCMFMYVNGYCVYGFPAKYDIGGSIPNAWLSFNPETGETFSLSVHQSCMKAGKYLLASDGGFPPGWNLLTLRGGLVNTDERFEYWSTAARDGVLYFSTQSDDRHGMMEHTSTLWRMDLQTGETTNLGTIEAERVTYICDTFALYYTSDQNGGAIRRMVF